MHGILWRHEAQASQFQQRASASTKPTEAGAWMRSCTHELRRLRGGETEDWSGADGTAGHGKRHPAAATARLGRQRRDRADALEINALMCAWSTKYPAPS